MQLTNISNSIVNLEANCSAMTFEQEVRRQSRLQELYEQYQSLGGDMDALTLRIERRLGITR